MQAANTNRIVLAAVAIGLLLLSLPLTWMTLHNAQFNFNGGPPGFPMPAMPAMQLDVTGLNGSITLGPKLPIWLLVVVGAGATVLAMLNELRIITIPPIVPLIALGVVGLFFASGIVVVFSDSASLGIGFILAMIGIAAAITLACLQLTKPAGAESSATD